MKKKPETTTEAFERLSAGGVTRERYVLQLFITGMSPRSTEAVANVKDICEELLPGNYDLEIVDLYDHPERAREQEIIAAPTLVKLSPLPRRRLIGNMAFRDRVLQTLGLQERKPPAKGKPR